MPGREVADFDLTTPAARHQLVMVTMILHTVVHSITVV